MSDLGVAEIPGSASSAPKWWTRGAGQPDQGFGKPNRPDGTRCEGASPVKDQAAGGEAVGEFERGNTDGLTRGSASDPTDDRHPLESPAAGTENSRPSCGKRQATGGSPVPGKDAVGRRGRHPPQASGPAHPPPRAAHPDRLRGRRSLRPHPALGLVAGERDWCEVNARPRCMIVRKTALTSPATRRCRLEASRVQGMRHRH